MGPKTVRRGIVQGALLVNKKWKVSSKWPDNGDGRRENHENGRPLTGWEMPWSRTETWSNLPSDSSYEASHCSLWHRLCQPSVCLMIELAPCLLLPRHVDTLLLQDLIRQLGCWCVLCPLPPPPPWTRQWAEYKFGVRLALLVTVSFCPNAFNWQRLPALRSKQEILLPPLSTVEHEI